MTLRNKEKLIGVIIMFLGVTFLMSSVFFIDLDEKDKKVKCFDRFRNEIIGEKCIEKADNLKSEFQILFMIGVMMVFWGFVDNSLSWDKWNEPKTNFFGIAVEERK